LTVSLLSEIISKMEGNKNILKAINLSPEERDILKKYHLSISDKKIADRIKAIILIDRGYTKKEIERILLIDRKTIRRYVKKYKKAGIDGLLKNNYSGYSGKLTEEQKEQLKNDLRENLFSTAKEVCIHVKKKFNISYKVESMVKLLNRLGFRYKKTKHVPGKADAKKQEEAGFLQNAIQNYMSAIRLLAQSGWSETQLENLQSKIMKLAEIFEKQKQIQPDVQTTIQTQIGEVASQPVVDKKAEALKAYEAKKKQEEDIQNQAFEYLDMAKKYEKDKKYDKAVLNYQKAIELLNSLGWIQQTQNIQLIVNKLKKERESYVSIQVQQEQVPPSIDEKLLAETSISHSEMDIRKQKLIEFAEKKKFEEEIQNKAFKLIDTAKSLEIKKQYDEAIKNFEQSIDLLKSIGWDSYIQPIFKSINDIKEKKAREIYAEEIRKKREKE